MENTIKSVLYISRAFSENSPVGTRYTNFNNYLKENYNLTTINLTNKLFLYDHSNFIAFIIYTLLRKLSFFPDSDIFILKAYKRAIKMEMSMRKFDYVIVQVLPFSFLLLAKYIKEISPSSKVVYDFSDPISLNVSFTNFSKNRQKCLLAFEKKNLSYVDHLIVLNDEIRNYYINFFSNKNCVSVIEQGYDHLAVFDYNYEDVNSKLELIYAGTFYRNLREPFELYNAIAEFDSKINLSIFGSIKKQFLPPNTSRFNYGGKISKQELYKKYQESDVIVFIDNDNRYQIPGKMFEILATGKAILCITHDINSASMKYLKQFDGVFYALNSKLDILSVLKLIEENKKFYWRRNLSEYQWPKLLKKIQKILG